MTIKIIFHFFILLTIVIPSLLVIIQIGFVSEAMSFNPLELKNWINVTDTFSLQMEALKILIAFTTVIGLYYKISQTEKQISQVEDRNAFSTFIEHRKYILESLDENLGNLVEDKALIVHPSKFYISIFPKNRPTDMANFDFSTDLTPIKFPNLIKVMRIVNHQIEIRKEPLSKRQIEEFVNWIGNDFKDYGFSFIPQSSNLKDLLQVIAISEKLISVLNFYSSVEVVEVEASLKYFNTCLKEDLIILSNY